MSDLTYEEAERIASSPALQPHLEQLAAYLDRYPYWVEMTPEERPTRIRAIAVEFLRNVLRAAAPELREFYRSALAGETPESLVESAAKAMAEEREYDWATLADLYGVPTHLGKDGLRRMARAALAPLLVQLQDKEERIKALEAALEAHAGCLAADRCPACSAIPEAP